LEEIFLSIKINAEVSAQYTVLLLHPRKAKQHQQRFSHPTSRSILTIICLLGQEMSPSPKGEMLTMLLPTEAEDTAPLQPISS